MKPAIEVIGAYQVDASPDVIERAYEMKYGDLGLPSREAHAARAAVVEELSGVALIELMVRHRDDSFEVLDFQQPDSDQVAYGEAFLTEDGTRVLSRDAIPDGEPLRIAFFLHFFNPALPLETSYGSVELPALQSMPDRLRDLVPYEPVE
jgi:hypothetical protein